MVGESIKKCGINLIVLLNLLIESLHQPWISLCEARINKITYEVSYFTQFFYKICASSVKNIIFQHPVF
jgi:hypothetical protein